MRTLVLLFGFWSFSVSSSTICTDYLISLDKLIAFLNRHDNISDFSKDVAVYNRLENALTARRKDAIREYNEEYRLADPFLLRSLEAAQSAWTATRESVNQSLPLNESMVKLFDAEADLMFLRLEYTVDPEHMPPIGDMADEIQERVSDMTDSASTANSRARIAFETFMFFSACKQE